MSPKRSRSMPSPAPEKAQKNAPQSESQQLFYTAFHASPTAIVLSRLSDGRFVTVNQSFLELTGYSMDEVIGLTSSEAGITTDPQAREQRLAALKKGGQLPSFEVDVIRKSGEVRNGLATVGIVAMEGEQFAISTFIDITERKRAERQVAQMKRLYATLSQVNQTIVRVKNQSDLFQSICDVAIHFGEFSLAWVGLLDEASGEIRPAAATGLDVAHWPFPIVNIHQGNGKDGLAATAIRTARTVTSEDVQTDARTQKQHAHIRGFAFHSSAVVPFRLKGKTIGMLGLVSSEANLFNAEEEIRLLEEMGLDISFALDTIEIERLRKEAALQLAKSEERFRTAFDNMLEGTQILGFDWRYRYLNRSAEIHNRRPSTELLGNVYMDMWPGIEATHVFFLIKRCMEERIPCEVENEFVYPNGGIGWFELKIQPIPEGVLILSFDITERKRAEAMRDKLASIVDASEDAILSKTLDGIITSWNQGSERLYGYSAEEAIGRSVSIIIPPHLPNELTGILERIRRGEHIQHYETIRVRKDGTKVDISITVSPLLNANGDVIGASTIARDITERKQVEEKLHVSESMLKLFVEYAPAAIAMFDRNMQYIAASRRFLHDYGLPDQEIIGRSHYELFPEISVRWKEIHQRCLAGATEKAEEDPFPRADGTVDWVRWEIRPWFEKSGAVGGLLLFSEVITERKRAEIALAESEAHYRQIIEMAQEGVWAIDANNHTTLANQRLADMLGYSIEEMKGKSIYDFMDDEGKAIASIGFARQTNGIKEQLDLKFKRKDGSAVWAITGTSSLNDEDGKYIGTLAMLTDITERKWAEEKIQSQIHRLNALREIDIAISASFGMKISLDAVVSRAILELNVDAADILVLNPDSGLLEYRAGWGFDTRAIQQNIMRVGEGTVGRCVQERISIHMRDLREYTNEFLRTLLLTEENFIGYYCVPLIDKAEVKGVLEIFHRSPLDPDQEWIDFLQTLAGQAAIAIEKATLFEGLQRSNIDLAQAYDATILGWSRAMDLRDKETAGHTQRVTELTLELAKAVGMSNEELVHIRRGALLHDMGKLGVPDDILLKPGKLTDDEWAVMRKHPQYAYDMLSFIQYLRPALDIPYCHHEKWDGTGYPRGLKGEQIPLAARLFAVVDVWDALRSDRPYRPSWPQEKVLDYIRSESGTHFDPQAVALFLQLISREAHDSDQPESA